MPTSLEGKRSSKDSFQPLEEPPDVETQQDTDSKGEYIIEQPTAPAPAHSKNDTCQEAPAEPEIEQQQRPDIVAKEEYSIFTINQKRAMILAASLCGWFRYETSTSPSDGEEVNMA